MKGLIIGTATGGIGDTFGLTATTDQRFSKVYWDGPKQHELDVTNEGMVEQYIYEMGPYDYIVYCAGIAHLDWIHDHKDEDINHVFSVNAFGFLRVMAAHEKFSPDVKGSALVLTSDAAHVPMRGSILYCASKAALVMMVRCMARELAPRWRVNAISSSTVEDTNMTAWIDNKIPEFRNWSKEHARDYEMSMVPMNRRVNKNEVAELMCNVLAGPEFMTGAIVNLTGGR